MKTYIYIFALFVLMYGIREAWYFHHMRYSKLAMTKSDGYHVIVKGKCYTL